MKTRLLVSPRDAQEALSAVEGEADIIDVKNPSEGSLGANFPWQIVEIVEALPDNIEVSAAIGDLDFKPGTASLAAYGLSQLGVDYVKAGLLGVANQKQALIMVEHLAQATRGSACKLVIAGYAEFADIGCVSPYELPEIARRTDAHGVMMDTARKNGVSLLEHHGLQRLQGFVDDAHSAGLIAALAGSLKMEDIKLLKSIKPDIIGVRSVVCDGDRVLGRISPEKVRSVKNIILG